MDDIITSKRLQALGNNTNDYHLLDNKEGESITNHNNNIEQFEVEHQQSRRTNTPSDYQDIVWAVIKPFICPFREGEQGRVLYLSLSICTGILVCLIIYSLITFS